METKLQNLKVAIVTEELTQLGGAERVLDSLIELFPSAPIYTIVWNDKKTGGKYAGKDIRTSFIQKLPFGVKKYKWYLPLMPRAIECLNLEGYDLVISSASALIKGVKTDKNQLHICYCHTPTRYLWTETKSYLKTAPIPFFVRPLMPMLIKCLRKWDLKASKRPDFYIANSENVRERIKKYYSRDSVAIFPPVDAGKIKMQEKPGQYYLIVSRIEPYKKVDLVIDAFKKLELPLRVVGSGTRFDEYKNKVTENIEMIGRVPDDELPEYYQNCIAFISPQEEDAGITPLEAMAAGRPVISYQKGGALESVVDGKTGIFFGEQTVESLMVAVEKLQNTKFDPKIIRAHAEKFDKEIFKQKVLEFIEEKVSLA